VPASNVDTRHSELNNVEAVTATANNLTLKLNRSKSDSDSSLHHRCFPISHVILGVTISGKLSVCAHVQNIVSSCASSLCSRNQNPSYPWKTVFRSVVIAKLKYAATACWGFTAATDRQRVEAVIRRGEHSGLCHSDIPTAAELIDDMDEDLFQRILWNENHTLHAMLPDHQPNLTYELRPRSHLLADPGRRTSFSPREGS